jgi:hypothetical protein
MSASEPPPPQRGQTAAERGRDVSAAQAEVEAQPSMIRRLVAAANPKVLLSQADGYPVGIKQFLWFCLILIYPAWLFFLIVALPVLAIGKVLYGIAWVIFWPMRAHQKKHHPEEYAASQGK